MTSSSFSNASSIASGCCWFLNGFGLRSRGLTRKGLLRSPLNNDGRLLNPVGRRDSGSRSTSTDSFETTSGMSMDCWAGAFCLLASSF